MGLFYVTFTWSTLNAKYSINFKLGFHHQVYHGPAQSALEYFSDIGKNMI